MIKAGGSPAGLVRYTYSFQNLKKAMNVFILVWIKRLDASQEKGVNYKCILFSSYTVQHFFKSEVFKSWEVSQKNPYVWLLMKICQSWGYSPMWKNLQEASERIYPFGRPRPPSFSLLVYLAQRTHNCQLQGHSNTWIYGF